VDELQGFHLQEASPLRDRSSAPEPAGAPPPGPDPYYSSALTRVYSSATSGILLLPLCVCDAESDYTVQLFLTFTDAIKTLKTLKNGWEKSIHYVDLAGFRQGR